MSSWLKKHRDHNLVMAGLCTAPLCIGAALSVQGGHVSPSLMPPCPFQTLTGLPCPLCGATRATVLAAHGDMTMFNYNFLWPLLMIAGIIGFVLFAAARKLFALNPINWTWIDRKALPLTLALLGVGWLCALANASTITA